jgi:hypothetical protein
MISVIEQLWPRITILLLLALIVSFLLFPSQANRFPPSLFIFSMAVAIALLLWRPIEAYRAGILDRAALLRQIFIDLAGFLFQVGAAMLAGRVAGAAGNAHWGPLPGLLSAFAAAFLAGMGAGMLWRRLALPRRSKQR